MTVEDIGGLHVEDLVVPSKRYDETQFPFGFVLLNYLPYLVNYDHRLEMQ